MVDFLSTWLRKWLAMGEAETEGGTTANGRSKCHVPAEYSRLFFFFFFFLFLSCTPFWAPPSTFFFSLFIYLFIFFSKFFIKIKKKTGELVEERDVVMFVGSSSLRIKLKSCERAGPIGKTQKKMPNKSLRLLLWNHKSLPATSLVCAYEDKYIRYGTSNCQQ